mmetsp:Transcript_38838/g.62904  ORF Transcript_38838/g.62904 Transcript_38838/m.62904 type:complete len:126 (-) Transcript_38838:65-442(-)
MKSDPSPIFFASGRKKASSYTMRMMTQQTVLDMEMPASTVPRVPQRNPTVTLSPKVPLSPAKELPLQVRRAEARQTPLASSPAKNVALNVSIPDSSARGVAEPRSPSSAKPHKQFLGLGNHPRGS